MKRSKRITKKSSVNQKEKIKNKVRAMAAKKRRGISTSLPSSTEATEKSIATTPTPNLKDSSPDEVIDMNKLTFEQQAALVFNPFAALNKYTISKNKK